MRNTRWRAGLGTFLMFVFASVFFVQPHAYPQARSQIVIAHPGPIHSLDSPVTWFIETHWVARLMYDCLIWRNKDQSGYVPELAERWENAAPDRWRFHLRKGATFHNGEAIDAQAIKWNLDRVRTRKAFMVHPQWQFIKEVRVVDKYTVDVITDGPQPYTEYSISFNGCDILPPQYVTRVGEKEFARKPVGSGPYKLVQFQEGRQYVFDAWEGYWGGRPKIDRIIYRIIPEQATQVAALLAGQVDLVPNVPFGDRERVAKAPGLKIVRETGFFFHILFARSRTDFGLFDKAFPGVKPVTLSKEIRQAISYALDRNVLANIQGGAYPTMVRMACSFSEVPKKYCGPEAVKTFYSPAKARELIRKAGYNPSAGKKPVVHLDVPNFQVGNEKEVAEVIKTMLEAVGFEVRLNVRELPAHLELIEGKAQFRDLALISHGAIPGLLPVVYSCSWPKDRNPNYVCLKEWDAVSKAILTEMDPKRRNELWKRWWEIFVDHASTITLYHTQLAYGMNAKLQWTPRSDGWVTPRDAVLSK